MSQEGSNSMLKPDFVARHYRGIIITLVMVNTALIMFLIVYIWAFAPNSNVSPDAAPVALGVIRADRVIMWSEPGGLKYGAESRGVVGRGSGIQILRGQRIESELWLEVNSAGRRGWIAEADVDYGESQPR